MSGKLARDVETQHLRATRDMPNTTHMRIFKLVSHTSKQSQSKEKETGANCDNFYDDKGEHVR